ncbi:MAG: fused MFS/spermidine synthase [Hyphomicrobiaceae bacterium]|nr:fused MFS/spermidine synthase [Hyphomicrobiaceae bacterium]
MSARNLVYLAITTISAACGLIIEIAAGRMVAPYIGMSLYTWTAIIAVVLTGFSIGHWIGGRLAEAPADRIRRDVAISLLLAGISTALSLVMIRLLAGPIIGMGLAPVPTILLLTTVLFFPPSLFVGIPSPALTKLAIDEAPDRIGHVLGTFYAASAAGSILGTLAAGFVFISWLGTINTFVMVAVAYFAMAIVLAVTSSDAANRTALSLAAIAAVSLAVLGLAGSQSRAFVSPCQTESDYYCIRVVQGPIEAGTDSRALVLDHLGHGINIKSRPETLVTPYVELQDIMARIHTGRRSPFRSFFIGGGAYTMPRAWLAARPDAEVVVAEVDPAVTRVAHRQLWLPRDKRLRIHHEDARRALAMAAPGTFDIVVGDAFHDITMPQHLATREFFALVKSRLADDGIYVMNVIDNQIAPRLLAAIRATLATQFPVTEVWRSTGQGERTTFIVAGLATATPYQRIKSKVTDGIVFERLGDDLGATQPIRRPLILTDDYAPVDRLIGVR